MEFIKKNLAKLILTAACFTCGVLMLIPVFILENFNFTGSSQTIGLILFFVGIATVFGLGICSKTKKIGKYALLGTGILTLIFLSIGVGGLSKTGAQGAIGKAYAYFANVEDTVAAGEITLAEKQAELNAKRTEFETSTVQVTGLGYLRQGWNSVITGFTAPNLFETTEGGTINPATTKLKDIVANPAITNGHANYGTIVQLMGTQSQLVAAGLGDQTLQTAPQVMDGIVAASSQTFPKLEEAIAQLQGVIDMNAAELAVGKTQIRDANAAAATIMHLYVCLIIFMGAVPIIVGIKKIFCKNANEQ